MIFIYVFLDLRTVYSNVSVVCSVLTWLNTDLKHHELIRGKNLKYNWFTQQQ